MPTDDQHPATAPLTIAFISPVVSGHSNVLFATLHQLLELAPGESPPLRLHLLGDEPLRKRLASLPTSNYHTFTFHALRETSFLEASVHSAVGPRSAALHPFRSGGLRPLELLTELVAPAGPEDYLRYHDRILDVLRSLKKDGLALCVVDILTTVGSDACKTAGVPVGIMSPVSSIDLSRLQQPGLRGFWKYPAIWTGFTFPVPLWQIPANILVSLMMIKTVVTSPRLRALNAARKEAGRLGPVHEPLDSFSFLLMPSVLAMEYPHTPLSNAVFCGPMLVPQAALSHDKYPELAAFLDRGKTVLLVMGTLFRFEEEDIRRLVAAIVEARGRLASRGKFQVLWKLPRASLFSELLDEAFTNAEDRAAVWVEEWIAPPMLSVVQHPNLVAWIHHGGANSVHEASYAGIPQIILPQWADCYDFATRVEALGHGIRANKGFDAQIDASQLADALERVLKDHDGEEGVRLKARAEEIARACRGAGGVRQAAETVIGFAKRAVPA